MGRSGDLKPCKTFIKKIAQILIFKLRAGIFIMYISLSTSNKRSDEYQLKSILAD